MASRGQSITVTVTAWNTSTLQGQTGDAANITLQWIKDGTIAPTTNSPVEVSAGAAPGEYNVTLTTGECTANIGKVCGVSSTPNVAIVPIQITFEKGDWNTVVPPTVEAIRTEIDANSTDLDSIGLLATAINAKTTNLPASPAAVGSAMTLTSGERTSIADAVLLRNVSNVESTMPEHCIGTLILAGLESAVDGTTWTIKGTDGTTTRFTKTVTTSPTADPITGVS